jgi:hypothetical protein
MITAEQLRARYSYDPNVVGPEAWRSLVNRYHKIGAVPGCVSQGYHRITIGGRTWGAHQLAWLYHYGALPDQPIDHINGNRLDNRISNLRLVTYSENSQNSNKTRAASGVRGVHKSRITARNKKPWMSQIVVNGKQKKLGRFNTIEEAKAAYDAARLLYHPKAVR